MIAYNNYNLSFSELLEMANESAINIRNLKFLFTEIFELSIGLSPPIMNKVFQINDFPSI